MLCGVLILAAACSDSGDDDGTPQQDAGRDAASADSATDAITTDAITDATADTITQEDAATDGNVPVDAGQDVSIDAGVDAGTCATAGCSADATCDQTSGVPLCTCKAGFTGSGMVCTQIDDCAINPCKNGGFCADGTNAYACSCTPGYSGATCEVLLGSCLALKVAAPTSEDGVYTIDTDGAGAGAPFQVYCDMSTNGGGWTKAYEQDINVAPAFSSKAEWMAGINTGTPSASQYAILHRLDELKSATDAFEFRLEWPVDPGAGSVQWQQLQNPLSSGAAPTISGVLMSPANQGGCGPFEGLSLSSTGATLLDGEPNSGCYWFAVGEVNQYGNGIPGYNSPGGVNGATRARLWVRAKTLATSCSAIKQANASATDGVYLLDPDGSGSIPPFAAYCDMTTDGGGWTKILQVGPSAYVPTPLASGNVATVATTDFAKLSDEAINAIGAAIGGARVYRIAGPTSSTGKKLFFASTGTFTDSAVGMGLMANALKVCENADYAACVTTTVDATYIDSDVWGVTGNDEDRYFADYGGSGVSCYNPGASGVRCFNAGASTGHAFIPNVSMWMK